MSINNLHKDDCNLEILNLVSARSLLLVLAPTFVLAGLASAAPVSEGVSLMQLQKCGRQHVSSFSYEVRSPASLAAYRSSEAPRCPDNLFSFSIALQSASESSKSQASSVTSTPQPQASRSEHRFWDRENDLLFAAVGASRTLDYFSTLNFR